MSGELSAQEHRPPIPIRPIMFSANMSERTAVVTGAGSPEGIGYAIGYLVTMAAPRGAAVGRGVW